MQTVVLLSFFVTPLLIRRTVGESVTVESIVFGLFLITAILSPRTISPLSAYRKSTGKWLVLSSLFLLGIFLSSTLITSNPPYAFVPYFIGYALIFLASFHLAWRRKSLNALLPYLPMITAAATVAALTFQETSEEASLRWTEMSLLIGFPGLLAATLATFRTISGRLNAVLFLASVALTIQSGSAAGILSFLTLAVIVLYCRMRRTRLPVAYKVVALASLVAVASSAIFLSSDQGGSSLSEGIVAKFQETLSDASNFTTVFRDKDSHARVRIYVLQWQLFTENMAFGIGLGGFRELNTEGWGGVALVNHNNLLKCLSEGGVFVGIAYMGFLCCYLYVIFKALFRRANSANDFSPLLIALASGMAFLLIRGFAMDTLFLRQFFVLAGLLAGSYAYEQRAVAGQYRGQR